MFVDTGAFCGVVNLERFDGIRFVDREDTKNELLVNMEHGALIAYRNEAFFTVVLLANPETAKYAHDKIIRAMENGKRITRLTPDRFSAAAPEANNR